MGLQLQMEQMPGYLAARFTGAGVAEEVSRQYELIAEHCKRAKCDKLLIDTTKSESEVSILERFFVAVRTQVFLFHDIKIAWVDNPARIHPQKFGEMVARNRLVNLRVFSNFQDAEEWLLN